MVIHLYSSLPKKTETQVLGAQLLRSGTGAGANYREAHRARRKAEFIAKCGDALRELEESAYWMELLTEGNIVRPEALLPMQRTERNFRNDHQSHETKLTSSFCLLTSSFT